MKALLIPLLVLSSAPAFAAPDMLVRDMEFSARVSACLRQNDITTLGKLVEKSEESLVRLGCIGRPGTNEIKAKLSSLGLELGRPANLTPSPGPVQNPANVAPASPQSITDASPLEALDLSARAHSCLMQKEIFTVGRLIAETEDSLRRTTCVGKAGLDEIRTRLAAIGKQLGSATVAHETALSENTSVGGIGLSDSTAACLRDNGVYRVGHLTALPREGLTEFKCLGDPGIIEVQNRMKALGLEFSR